MPQDRSAPASNTAKSLDPRGTGEQKHRNPHLPADDPFQNFVTPGIEEQTQHSRRRALSPDVLEAVLHRNLDLRPVNAQRIARLEEQAERHSPMLANMYCLEQLVKALPWVPDRGQKNAFDDVIDWPALARKLNEAQYTPVFGPERSAEYFRRMHVETEGGLRALVATKCGHEEPPHEPIPTMGAHFRNDTPHNAPFRGYATAGISVHGGAGVYPSTGYSAQPTTGGGHPHGSAPSYGGRQHQTLPYNYDGQQHYCACTQCTAQTLAPAYNQFQIN